MTINVSLNTVYPISDAAVREIFTVGSINGCKFGGFIPEENVERYYDDLDSFFWYGHVPAETMYGGVIFYKWHRDAVDGGDMILGELTSSDHVPKWTSLELAAESFPKRESMHRR